MDNQECSGCGSEKPTVDRYMFDGLCAECTNKGLYDYEFAEKARQRNEKLKNQPRGID